MALEAPRSSAATVPLVLLAASSSVLYLESCVAGLVLRTHVGALRAPGPCLAVVVVGAWGDQVQFLSRMVPLKKIIKLRDGLNRQGLPSYLLNSMQERIAYRELA